eukprot:TRINITY_DN23472_c0_g1_i1.p1 TRINITY_DN23472_c0_g1~~TRINITY_DN23472_c0_g1_i1.p1  ORF type:complete len:340 (+),score=33.55 TRINITY_DN23472_c0_g1_i1:193-1212(+)
MNRLVAVLLTLSVCGVAVYAAPFEKKVVTAGEDSTSSSDTSVSASRGKATGRGVVKAAPMHVLADNAVITGQDRCTAKYGTDVCGCWGDPTCGFCVEEGRSVALTFCIEGTPSGPNATTVFWQGSPVVGSCPQSASTAGGVVRWEGLGDEDSCRAAQLAKTIGIAAGCAVVVIVGVCWFVVRGQYWIRSVSTPPPRKSLFCECGPEGRKNRAGRVAPCFPQNPCRYFCSPANFPALDPENDPHPPGLGCACLCGSCCGGCCCGLGQVGCPSCLVDNLCTDLMPEEVEARRAAAMMRSGCCCGLCSCCGLCGGGQQRVGQQPQKQAPGQTNMSAYPTPTR